MLYDHDALVAELRRDEGVKDTAYRDSLGWWTIGVGHLIDPAKGANPAPFGVNLIPAGRLTADQINALLAADIDDVVQALDDRLPWWSTLDPVRQRVIINMAFNLGVTGLLGFKNTLAAIQARRWSAAAAGMLNSKWASQVGARAKRLAKMMETGAA